MALILCIETSTKNCSVSISENGKIIDCIENQNDKYSHSEELTIFISELLKNNNIDFKDLDAVAISKGPGSYTGLRIGASTAKGLCYALDIPLLSISTLESMALEIAKENPGKIYCPMIDARRNEVYCMLINQKEILTSVEAKIIKTDSFIEFLEFEEILFFGDGAEKCKKIIDHKNANFISDFFPSSKFMSSLAERSYKKKKFENIAYFEPFYLKDFIIS